MHASIDVESSDRSSACSNGRPVVSLLEELKAPKLSDLARKKEVAVNLPPSGVKKFHTMQPDSVAVDTLTAFSFLADAIIGL